jgi:hypothetical protein
VFIITWYKIYWFGYKVTGYIPFPFPPLLTFEPIIGGGKYYGFFGVSCNSTRITLGKNRKYLVFCDNCEAKKTIPYDIIRIPFVFIHEDLISPLATASKRKYVRSTKESDNAIINTEK